MIGNRVRIIRIGDRSVIQGVLHSLDARGAVLYREHSLPEGQGGGVYPNGTNYRNRRFRPRPMIDDPSYRV
jgi:hypothetical protein